MVLGCCGYRSGEPLPVSGLNWWLLGDVRDEEVEGEVGAFWVRRDQFSDRVWKGVSEDMTVIPWRERGEEGVWERERERDERECVSERERERDERERV